MKKIMFFLVVLLVACPRAMSDSSKEWPCNRFIKNWGICNSNRVQSSIHAVESWKLTRPSKKVVVAVIDTGVSEGHRDLASTIWIDQDELKRHNTVYGWNFVTDQPNPLDDHGHGTHVAGIIAADYDSKTGVSGVAPGVQIMSVKYYSDANPGSVNLRNTIKAINYAVDHGAQIINYSGGGPEFNEDEYLALKKAEYKGVLVVAAAGNEHQNVDLVENYYYPSAYRLSNIISVAAIDINNNLLPSSNYGKTKVDIAAPGENIYSTLPGQRFGYMSGTSMAAPFVTGVAALLKSCNPRLSPTQIKSIILESVYKIPQMSDRVATGGRVDAYRALKLAHDRHMCVR